MDHIDDAGVRVPHLGAGFIWLAAVTVGAIALASRTSSIGALVVLAVATVVAMGTMYWLALAQPSIDAIAKERAGGVSSRADSAALRQQVADVSAEKERASRKVQRLGGILAATQHELNREITMLGFAVDDVVDDAGDGAIQDDSIDQLKVALDHVEEGQRNVAALSRLGTSERVEHVEKFRASDIAPLTTETDVMIERDDPIYGDVALWRLFVKNAVRNSEAHGRAATVTLSSGDGRLSVADDGVGCASSDLEQAWKAGLRPNGTKSDGTQIMRRIAEAHEARVTLQGEEGAGVRIVVDLRDIEIDLRHRGALTNTISTPHKTSGGRISI